MFYSAVILSGASANVFRLSDTPKAASSTVEQLYIIGYKAREVESGVSYITVAGVLFDCRMP